MAPRIPGPTPRQREYLIAIDTISREKGRSPSTAEIAAAIGVNTVSSVLLTMSTKGFVRSEPGKWFSIELTDLGRSFLAEPAP